MTQETRTTTGSAGRERAITLTGGRQIAALEWGDPGPAGILAIHGWLDNAASFELLAAHLDPHPVVAIDLPGHGRSDHRPRGSFYHLGDYVFDVLEVLEVLGWQRVRLLGHSLGAGVATLAAATLPEWIDRLVLIEGLGPLTSPPGEILDRFRSHWERRRAPRREPERVFPSPEDAVRARHRAGGLSWDAARRLTMRSIREVPGGWTWSSDPRLRWPSPHPFTEDHVLAFLDAIRCPVLLVLATERDRSPEHALAHRARRVADLEQVRLPGAHHLHLEDPAAVAGVIRPFLDRVSGECA